MLRRSITAIALALGVAIAPQAARAAGEYDTPPPANLSFQGFFGTFDRASAQRGLQVYRQVCASCHGLRLVAFRNLRALGLTDEQIAAIAAEYEIQDGPNDEGQMFERPGRPSDRFRSPFPNERAARAANNGAYPPDLSVMTKARHYGANYIRAMLVGYQDPPAGVTIGDGMHYNRYFPGRQIAMANVLFDDMMDFADGTPATAEQMARDVTTFLAWAAEPEMEQRRQMGIRVVLFLLILGGLTYAVKRRVWSDVKH
jgi:ubiquinol-cytochrome c reductase cytochrome c1 subunit